MGVTDAGSARRLHGCAILLAILAATSACAASEQGAEVSAVIRQSEPNLRMQALLAGTVELTPDGCFALRRDQTPDILHVIIFPYESKLDSSVPAVNVPDWGPVAVGDHIESGGGEISSDDHVASMNVPATCKADQYVVLDFIE